MKATCDAAPTGIQLQEILFLVSYLHPSSQAAPVQRRKCIEVPGDRRERAGRARPPSARGPGVREAGAASGAHRGDLASAHFLETTAATVARYPGGRAPASAPSPKLSEER